MTDVLVVGAGAVGLYAAAAFATAGFDVEVWEKRGEAQAEESPPLSRAIGIHPPALHALDMIGVGEQVAAEAVRVRRAHARATTTVGAGAHPRHVASVSFDGVSRRFPFIATLPQHRTEALIAEAIRRLGDAPGHGTVTVSRGVEVVVIAPDPRGVTVRGVPAGRADESSARRGVQTRARFVVVAEGAGSMSTRRLGVPSSGRDYPDTYLMGDASDTTGDGDDAVVTLSPDGVVESFPLPGGVRRFVAHTPRRLDGAGPDTLARLVGTRTGQRVDPDTVTMLSTFGVRRRIARRFSVGTRIAIVGDAAHEISPIGGQGMNLGWLDVAELVPVVTALLGGAARGGSTGVTATVTPPASETLVEWGTRRRRASIAAARQAELNMRVSAPGPAAEVHLRSLVLGAALQGPAGARLARVYAMGGDPPGVL